MPEAFLALDAMDAREAREALTRCCGSRRWVEGMLSSRPFDSAQELTSRARALWAACGRDDYLEAFSHHPRIGANMEKLQRQFASTLTLSAGEQAGVTGASEATLRALLRGNEAYFERFGYIFIVCATGKTAEEMLALLEARLHNPPELELSVAAAEQEKITLIRLEKLSPCP